MEPNLKKSLIVLTAFSLCFSPIVEAHAASKKKVYKRSDFSKEQQAKFFADALKACRAHFKSEIVGVKVDYARNRYTCRGR
jgi:hypothetical protein